jgi:hypothetical protein
VNSFIPFRILCDQRCQPAKIRSIFLLRVHRELIESIRWTTRRSPNSSGCKRVRNFIVNNPAISLHSRELNAAVSGDLRVQLHPQQSVTHHRLLGISPPIPLPVWHPFIHTFLNILRVRRDPHDHAWREERNGNDHRAQFHHVVRGVSVMPPHTREPFALPRQNSPSGFARGRWAPASVVTEITLSV